MYTCENCDGLVSFDASGEPMCLHCDRPLRVKPAHWWQSCWVLFSDWVEEMAS